MILKENKEKRGKASTRKRTKKERKEERNSLKTEEHTFSFGIKEFIYSYEKTDFCTLYFLF